jgi:uncharacterized membrane protein
VPVALLAPVLIPAVAGSLRRVELTGGPQLMPPNPRLTASPVPVAVHILSEIAYSVLGSFQFSANFRRSHPRWYRYAGRMLVMSGLAVAVSALWMTPVFSGTPGTLLYTFRLALGSGMAASIMLGAGWAINLAVAAWIIRRGDPSRHGARFRHGRTTAEVRSP